MKWYSKWWVDVWKNQWGDRHYARWGDTHTVITITPIWQQYSSVKTLNWCLVLILFTLVKPSIVCVSVVWVCSRCRHVCWLSEVSPEGHFCDHRGVTEVLFICCVSVEGDLCTGWRCSSWRFLWPQRGHQPRGSAGQGSTNIRVLTSEVSLASEILRSRVSLILINKIITI